MVNKFLTRYADRFISKWLVLAFDTTVVFLTFLMAKLLRFNFDLVSISAQTIVFQSITVISLYVICFFIFRSFSGIIRHTSFVDAFRIFKASFLGFLVLFSISYYNREHGIDSQYFPGITTVIIHFMMLPFFLFGSRLFIKSIYSNISRSAQKRHIRVIIYGAGSAGMLTRNALMQDAHFFYEVIAFIDENTSKISKMLEGIPVISPSKAFDRTFIERHLVSQMIIAIQSMPLEKRKQIVETGLEHKLTVKVVPAIGQWINGQLSATQLRDVRIEELLERDPIRLDNEKVSEYLHNKIVMVTGAAGSIGSEIVRQILQYKPARVLLVDQAESPLFDLQYEINSDPRFKNLTAKAIYLVANVKDRLRMERIFETYQPQIIFHAAAYKHVPLMEDNPYEAMLVNVFGTKIIADLAVKYHCRRFVMISTDKAVNPTNVMGASKRIAEIYTQSLSNGRTEFITTRFGNVLGSNGSVIPIFKKQIEKGGPVTVTHKDITRFFMTIPEACNLVLEAGSMGSGGEIFVFDMGKAVKIYDLARKMIQLSGFEPERDIKIIESGLRPGEKLYEELLANDENTLHTHHPKIMRARVRHYEQHEVKKYINDLSELIVDWDEFQLVSKMKEIVPEFISNNSVFSKLDKTADRQ
jgi:FlaA1/EpsC-like NDP-sugar epimerase